MKLNIAYTDIRNPLPFAAKELKDYLEQIDPTLSVSINGSHTERQIVLSADYQTEGIEIPELDDAYQIQVHHLNGAICGTNPRSVLLGVYYYLYLLGCRFLRPGKEYQVIPSLSGEDSYDAFSTRRASIRHRGVCIEGADSVENVCEFIDWLPKLGFNSFFVQFQIPYEFLNNWYRHTSNPNLPAEDFNLDIAKRMSDEIDEEMNQRGLLHHRVGHGWTCEALGQSALGWLKSETPLKEDYRKYLASLNGKRDYYLGIPINTNLCYSNPEAIKRMTECVCNYAQDHMDIDYLHVWLADNSNNHCECEHCSGHLPTDLYINLLNEIDAELTRRQLNTRIVFLLYLELLWPPRKEVFKNPSRFILMFAPISRTFTHTYEEQADLKPIPPYQRNHITLPTSLGENLSFLNAWQSVFQGDSFVYDYHLARAHYGDPGYIAITNIIYRDIHYLKALGLHGYMSCQEMRAALPNALPNYVMGLSLFDEALSLEDITEDYFKHAYGDGWEDCLAYLTELSSLYNCDYFNKKGERINPEIAANMEKALQVLSKAESFLLEKEQTAPPTQKRFYQHLSYHNKACRLLTKALFCLSSGDEENTRPAWAAFVEFIRANELTYQKALDVYRIIEVGTNYTKFPKLPD